MFIDRVVNRKIMDWINIKDKDPNWKETVLVWHDDNGLEEWDVGVGFMDNCVWTVWGFSDYSYDEITYWMPIPKPPK